LALRADGCPPGLERHSCCGILSRWSTQHGHGQVTIAEDDVLTREGLQAFSNRWPCLASKTPGDTYNS
jgi:hypothetical protein